MILNFFHWLGRKFQTYKYNRREKRKLTIPLTQERLNDMAKRKNH